MTDKNYTEEMVAILSAAQPLTFESAGVLGKQLDRTQRSVISKAKSLGLIYNSKTVSKKRGPSKTVMVASIEKGLGFNVGDLAGLEKATSASLDRLFENMA